jgi:hypothetical protein
VSIGRDECIIAWSGQQVAILDVQVVFNGGSTLAACAFACP